MGNRNRRRLRALLVTAGMFVVVLMPVAGSAVRVAWMTSDKQYPAGDAPPRDIGLVLGARVDGSGRPSKFLAARLDVALDLFQQGKVRALLVSGDGYAESFYETREMKDYLVQRGVPAERIVEDVGGFDTYDSCRRARDTFGVTEMTIITQDYHLPRAIALCEGLGVDAIGVPDTTMRQQFPQAWQRNALREFPANIKMEWDLLVNRRPLQEDPPTDALEQALDS